MMTGIAKWYSVLNVKAGSMQNVKDFQVKDKNDQYVYTKCSQHRHNKLTTEIIFIACI
jgi:hypothetical protein